MAKILTRCPVCEAALHVSELSCARCKTRVQSQFETCRFCRLAPEHLAFVELFLRNEGNLSRVGAHLGLSYPTVRNKLGAALSALGVDDTDIEDTEHATSVPVSNAVRPSPEHLERRRLILEQLEEGSLDAEEAALALRETI